MSQPWEQLPTETAEEYARFVAFRDRGPLRDLNRFCRRQPDPTARSVRRGDDQIDCAQCTDKVKEVFIKSMTSIEGFAALRLRDGKWIESLKDGGRITHEEAK